MTTLTQFTVFPKLSDDLKAMIWDFASQESSRIQFESYVVRKRKNAKKKNNEPASERDKVFSGKHPDYPSPRRLSGGGRVPSVLITCRESRYWAMKHYHLDFKDQLYRKALWFNSKVDTLYFDSLDTLPVFVQGGCSHEGESIPLIRDSSKMPVVERTFMLCSISTCHYRIAVETMKNFPHLKSLVTRTDDVDTEGVFLPQFWFRMNQLWSSDEWKAIRACGQIPELQILTMKEMWCSGLILPFGPSNKIKRQLRSSKADASPVPPARRSGRIKSIKTTLDVED